MLAGPASRAACITFDRPSAKSNCADVNAVDDRKFARFTAISGILPDDRVQFADPVGRAVRKRGSGPDRIWACPARGRLDLAEAGYDLAGLGGHRERFDHAAHQQSLGIGGKRRRDADVALEPLLNWLRRTASATV